MSCRSSTYWNSRPYARTASRDAGRERTPRRLVGQRERRVEERHRLAVDDVPVAGGRDTERFEHLAVGDAAQRATECEPAGGRHRVGEVQCLGVDGVGGPERDRQPEYDVEGRRVAATRRLVDDVVVHQRAQVQELDRGRALHRGRTVAAGGQGQDHPGAMPRPGRGDRSERIGDGLAERVDHPLDQAVDVGQQGTLVRHGARR